MTYAFFILIGALAGFVIAWLISSTRLRGQFQSLLNSAEQRASVAEGRASALDGMVAELKAQNQRADEDFQKLRSKLEIEQQAKVEAVTRLEESVKRFDEEKVILDEARTRLVDAFKAVAGDTLGNSTTSFLKLARESFDKLVVEAKGDLGARQEAIQGLVKPLSDSVRQFEEHVRIVEKERQEAYAGLTEQVKGLSDAQRQLREETGNLVTALRKPHVRGRWGEMTLRRVVELAGMCEHCDFDEQVSADSDGGKLRPDMVVRLPADRQIVVDAKVSLEAYLDAVSADSEDKRKQAMSRHAAQVRVHMNKLADKSYWEQFSKAPEFVVMFIPGDSFFGAAVEADSTLIESAMERHVVLATPTTLIALIRAVAFGWRQEQVAENAQAIAALGRQLYERMSKLAEHIDDVGRGLEKATKSYNNAVGSMENRVFSTARRFKELGAASGGDLPDIRLIEVAPRQVLPEA